MQEPEAIAFMRRAIELAQLGPYSDNPRVGAVVVNDGVIVGEGFHHGAGTAHAEAVALRAAGEQAKNATIYVSLEPCAHVGRTGPCTTAIIDAGVSRVIYAQVDPTDNASGGHQVLVDAGLEVVGEMISEESEAINREWTHWVRTGRPFVTWKFAQSLDSRVSAAIGTQTALSSSEAQVTTHQLRSRVDAIVVGTNTVLIDDPVLTARTPNGDLFEKQPLRIVIGATHLPQRAKLFETPGGRVVHYKTRDIEHVLRELAASGVKHILLEGGPTLARAFLSADAVQEVVAVIAPVTLGAGPLPLSGLLDRSYQVCNIRVVRVGPDLVISGIPVAG